MSSAWAETAAPAGGLFFPATVFSDSPTDLHDPRYAQSQTSGSRMFAPIGLITTNHPVPHQAGINVRMALDMATAFLVSPCYVLTVYHAVFGNGPAEPSTQRDYSMTFRVRKMEARAVPVMHGAFPESEAEDWALLRLVGTYPCMGATPNIGWVTLGSLPSADIGKQKLSIAGYPSDKDDATLWRQDRCALLKKVSARGTGQLWTTDCATLPRASGSPIFFIKNGLLQVVAIMHGHLGDLAQQRLWHWDPIDANLAIDVADILRSHPDVKNLIDQDIDQFHRANPAQVQARPSTKTEQPPTASPSKNCCATGVNRDK